MPRKADLTGKGVSHDYTVLYQSGIAFRLKGVFEMMLRAKTGNTPLIRDGETIHALDPRAIVMRRGGLVYDPRDWIHRMSTEMRTWMEEHPEWPPREVS